MRKKKPSNKNISSYKRGSTNSSKQALNERQLRLKAIKNKDRLEIIGVFVLAVIVMVATLYSSLSPNVQYDSARLANPDDVKDMNAVVKDALQEQGLRGRFKPTLDIRQAEGYIANSPLVESANLNLNIFQARPKVNIKLAIPFGYYQAAGQNYVLSDQGTIMGKGQGSLKSYAGVDLGDLVVVKSSRSVEAELDPGLRVLSKDDIKFIKDIAEALKTGQGGSVEVPTVQSYIVNQNPRELSLEFTDQTYRALLFLDNEPGEQIASLYESFVYLSSLPVDAERPVDYIDLRLAPRVIYR